MITIDINNKLKTTNKAKFCDELEHERHLFSPNLEKFLMQELHNGP